MRSLNCNQTLVDVADQNYLLIQNKFLRVRVEIRLQFNSIKEPPIENQFFNFGGHSFLVGLLIPYALPLSNVS